MTIRMTLIASVALATAFALPARAEESVEVMHWWTSGGEAKALNVLKESLEKQGVKWKDAPVAGGSGVQAMAALRARVTAGDPPTAVQMLGFDIRDFAKDGVGDISEVAVKGGWDKVIPAALQDFSKYEGKWIAAPVNVHSTNWVWANKAVMDKLGVKDPPKNWDEFVAVLDKAKAAGVTALAHGGQPWQDGTVFEGVLLTTGGPDFYKKAFIDLDPATLGSDQMKTVFDRMTKLRSYVDSNFSGRDWNLASAMVIKGEAAFQVMGDWAKGEFIAAGKKPGADFVCFRFPGTQGIVTFNADQFVAFNVGKDKQAAQLKFAAAVEDPAFQSAFNVVKGSAPARTDVSDEAFDDCGKKAIKDLKEASGSGKLIGSLAHGYAAPPAVKQAFFDVITKQFNGGLTSEQAVKELVTAVAAAK